MALARKRSRTRVRDRFRAKAILFASYVFDVVSGSRDVPFTQPDPQPRTQKVLAPPAAQQPLAVPQTRNTLQPGDLEAPWVGPVDSDA